MENSKVRYDARVYLVFIDDEKFKYCYLVRCKKYGILEKSQGYGFDLIFLCLEFLFKNVKFLIQKV